jgi:membrane-associated PAP2 superfamily phosphatase
MPTVLIRCMLFLSSYFPLALIFFFLFIEQQPVWAIAVLAISLAGLIIMVLERSLFMTHRISGYYSNFWTTTICGH